MDDAEVGIGAFAAGEFGSGTLEPLILAAAVVTVLTGGKGALRVGGAGVETLASAAVAVGEGSFVLGLQVFWLGAGDFTPVASSNACATGLI